MELTVNEPITEVHFKGTFTFPNDLDCIGCTFDRQCAVDLFNKMIEQRLCEMKYFY